MTVYAVMADQIIVSTIVMSVICGIDALLFMKFAIESAAEMLHGRA